jgi:hypothetical protein
MSLGADELSPFIKTLLALLEVLSSMQNCFPGPSSSLAKLISSIIIYQFINQTFLLEDTPRRECRQVFTRIPFVEFEGDIKIGV